MRIKSLELLNFRQFYGEQKINFSQDNNANVTIIHGENGSGKTALLNAFKWAFYGTTDFETKGSNLISERCLVEASKGDELKTSIVVEFSHEGRDYLASRVEFFKKQDGLDYKNIGKSKLDLSWIGEDGAYKKSPNPTTHINQILPSRMHPYFFFNGERIEKLSNVESSPEIQQAIKGMMGIEIIERAGRHLSNYVIKDLKKDLKGLSTDELKDVMEEEGFYKDRVQEAEDKINSFSSEKRHYRTLLSDINKKLAAIGPIAELQKERESLDIEIKSINEKINTANKENLQYVSRYGFLSISRKMIDEVESILDEKRKKGELPAKIKVQFLTDLLNNKLCICKRALEPGSDSYDHVEKFKKSAVPNDVENAFITTSSSVAAMKVSRPLLFDTISRFRKQIKEYEADKTKKHGRIDEIAHRLGTSEVEDVVKLENAREERRDKISELDQLLGKWNDKLSDSKESLAEWVKKRKELDKKGDAASVANERLELAEEMERVINLLHQSLSETVRVELSEIVNDTFSSIMKKDYWAEIDSDYTLQIRKKIGEYTQNVVDKSTGESQVSSLSFIGGLVSLAKKRYGQQGGEYYRGGIFPIVMDSPYGNLDPEYKAKVANYIPSLAEQVIVMVSNSQWSEEVQAAVKGRVGSECTLIYHTPHKKEDTKTSSVIGGEKYEYTKIEEGYYE